MIINLSKALILSFKKLLKQKNGQFLCQKFAGKLNLTKKKEEARNSGKSNQFHESENSSGYGQPIIVVQFALS